MISVGTNENVVFSKAEINEKGTLVIGFKELGTEVKEKKELSVFEQMEEGSDASGDSSSGETIFLMFMPNLTDFDDKTKPAEAAKILQSFVEMKNQLSHVLLRFTTSPNIKFAPWAGVPVNLADEAATMAAIQTKAVAEKVYNNYAQQFLAMAKPFLNKEDKPGRLFLHRRSEAVHYGTLRRKFLESQPFWEGMEIPVEASKLWTKQVAGTTKYHEAILVGEGESAVKYVPAFTAYEIKNKLDNPAKLDIPADASATAEEEIANVSSLFTAAAASGAPTVDGGAITGAFSIEE